MKKILGILNITPDSFSDGGCYFNSTLAIKQGLKLWEEGADCIDVGGESTRPGALSVSWQEEIKRVMPVVSALVKEGVFVSIDTCKPEVAKEAVERGACMINDVTGFSNPKMREIAKESSVFCCIMHMQGTPKIMQERPHYPQGVLNELLQFFQKRTDELLERGIQKEKILIDPGIGFGKSLEDNYTILDNLPELKGLGFSLLVGLSRKSFMGKVLNRSPSELLCPTIAMNTSALLKGADWIRVHDVKEHKEVITLLEKLGRTNNSCGNGLYRL
jgi:dihydropteroate synthase